MTQQDRKTKPHKEIDLIDYFADSREDIYVKRWELLSFVDWAVKVSTPRPWYTRFWFWLRRKTLVPAQPQVLIEMEKARRGQLAQAVRQSKILVPEQRIIT